MRCSFSILCEVLPLNRSLTIMIVDLLQILLTEDLQSSGSLLFRGSILDWGCFKFVRCSFFKIGCFIFHLGSLIVEKQIYIPQP